MKKFITIMLVFALAFSTLTISTFAASSSKTTYVKVKKTTYLRYKKAYEANKKLKVTIKQQKATIASLTSENEDQKATIDSLTNENANLKEQLNNMSPNDDIDELKHRLSQQEDINDWLWMSFRSLGITYTNKTWTVPASYPEKFIINGTTYTVIKEE